MERTADGITYTLTRRRVRNINLRVRADGSVAASASPRVPAAYVDAFVTARADWVRTAQARAAARREREAAEAPALPPKAEALAYMQALCRAYYPQFAATCPGGAMPKIAVRDMNTRWGSCSLRTGTLAFARRLCTMPLPAQEYDQLEEQLILADVGPACAVRLVDELHDEVKEKHLKTGQEALDALRGIICQELTPRYPMDLDGKPAVILVIGVNGVGKTTTIAKLAGLYKKQGRRVMLAAGDTFRAAASEQLELWAERAGVPLVQAGMGADPAAVIFDAVKSANARGYDMVIADTAGRLHNKKGLMDELSKISRSVKKASPEASLEVLLVLDAITGQNAISQAEEFCKAANATGVVLTKLDGTPRGGCAVSVWENLGLPIRFIGVGEKIDDLMEFDAQTFVESLLPESALQKDGEKEEGESEA